MANKAVSQQWRNTENFREKFDISRANWNLHEMTATQFCCNSVSCVTGDTSSRYWLDGDGDGDVTFFFNSARPCTHYEQLSFNHFHQGPVHQAHLPIQNCPSCAIIDK